MDESEISLIKQIRLYKNILERTENVEEKMNTIIALDHLPINVSHLEKTGIGKTVNNLRKYDLDENVVIAARELKDKWKNMALAFWKSDDTSQEKSDAPEKQ